MNNQVTINKDTIINAYQQATEEQKELLENMFGKDMFLPKDIRNRIKAFDDAFYALGDKHVLVREYKHLLVYNCMSKDIIAYAKLRIIAEALNEGWEPTFDEGEYRYYPLFQIYTKKQYDELDEDEKKECHTDIRFINDLNAYRYIIYSNASYKASVSITNYGSQIALKTRKLAEYFGKQFIDIWADYLFA